MSTVASLFPCIACVLCSLLFSREAAADVGTSTPSFRETPSDTETVVGSDVQLKCSFNNLGSHTPQWQFESSAGDPLVEITYGYRIFDDKYQLKGDLSKGEYHLFIPNIAKDLSGTYDCSLLSSPEDYRSAELIVHNASSLFKETPSDTVTVVGSAVQLKCSFNNVESQTPQWQFKSSAGDPLVEITHGSRILNDKYQLTGDLSKGEYHLFIPNVAQDLSGTYDCSLLDLREDYRSAELTVLDFPECRVGPRSTVVSDKDVVTFTCHINGILLGDLVWLRNGEEISRRTAATNEYQTTLKKADNGARFNCRYENQSFPSHSWPNSSCHEDIIMDVQYGPDVKINGTDKDEITVLEGQSVSLECVTDANPQAESHEWIISIKDRTVVSSNLTYYIPRVDCKDAGVYGCIASNKFHDGTIGTGNASLSLSVKAATVGKAPAFQAALGFHFFIVFVTAIIMNDRA
ncbi:pregnancy-specific beta-1-glycoprotein 9-like [Ptychodera flava]|uniref:pregnancy-specific beta-1-glycoprotein 9-like n=1 Tax=Ptychodera flava TaxID=63121 RepID=UPI003969D673